MFVPIEWDDNPHSVDECIWFTATWLKYPKRTASFWFIEHMVGWMRATWCPEGPFLHKPVWDLFLCEHGNWKDSKREPFSRSELRRRQGSLWVNDILVDEHLTLEPEMLIQGTWAVLRAGKRTTGQYWIVGLDPTLDIS